MPAKRRSQSFRGLVRERLAEIEYELARGIDQQTVLTQLLSGGASIGTFRNALYRARKSAASFSQFAAAKHRALFPQPTAPTVSQPPIPAGPLSTARRQIVAAALDGPKPERQTGKSTDLMSHQRMENPRDFMSRVRNTGSNEII